MGTADSTRYISLVAASCMVLYGYDASVFNAVQGSKNWNAYFNKPGPNIIGAINTSYTVGAVVAGFFLGGPLADFAGRRVGMAAGSLLVIVATLMQTFSPRGNIGCFIAGRVIIGLGQGLALSKFCLHIPITQHANRHQLLVLSTLVNWHPQKFEEKSCLSGKCFTRSAPSWRTGSTMPAPNTLSVSANGTGRWLLSSSSLCLF